MIEKKYMQRAIELARLGRGYTSPNPLVGAVIVKDGEIIGEGYHQRIGGLHAERNAIASLKGCAEGADIYVTLEPCCHYGRTPPCTEAIIQNKLARVIVGSRDPNPLVSGKGAAMLRAHGIEVVEDYMRSECNELNPAFFHYITTGRPYVTVKFAESVDGKIAAYTGLSKWITGEKARAHVHSLRGEYAAVLAGIGTVLADDPMLNCRLENAHQPLRVIADSKLRIPLESNICKTAKQYETLVAFAEDNEEKREALEALGVKTVCLPDENGRVDLSALMEHLGAEKISSVLVEGGGEIGEAAFKAGIVSHVCAYVAPKIIGGRTAKTPVEGSGFSSPDSAVLLSAPKVTAFDGDLLLEYDVLGGKPCLPE